MVPVVLFYSRLWPDDGVWNMVPSVGLHGVCGESGGLMGLVHINGLRSADPHSRVTRPSVILQVGLSIASPCCVLGLEPSMRGTPTDTVASWRTLGSGCVNPVRPLYPTSPVAELM